MDNLRWLVVVGTGWDEEVDLKRQAAAVGPLRCAGIEEGHRRRRAWSAAMDRCRPGGAQVS
eukprot:scaffold232776_cov28-Tisochrysis_lutea.AAC.3